MRSYTDQVKVLDEVSTNKSGGSVNVKDYRHLIIEVAMTGFTGTVKFASSMKEDLPNFSASKSLSNPFDEVQVKELQNGSTINGDTGVSGTATTDVVLYEVNTNGQKWFNAITSSVTAGTVSVKITPFND